MNLAELRERLWWELNDGTNIDDMTALTSGYDIKLINEAIRDLADCLHIIKHDKTLLPSSAGVVTLPDDFLEVLRVQYKTADLQPVTNVFDLAIGSGSVQQYTMSGRTKMELYDIPPAVPVGLTVTSEGQHGEKAYSYCISAVTSKGVSLVSAVTTVDTGSAVLDKENFNRLTWEPVTGAVSYNVYWVSGGTLWYLGSVTEPVYDDTGAVSATEGGDHSLHLRYRAYPAILVNDGDSPDDIPAEFHEKLVTVYAKAQFVRKFDYQIYQALMGEWTTHVKKILHGLIYARCTPVHNDNRWEW